MNDRLVHERMYRGPKVLKAMESLRVAICGAGAVGSNLVDNMARQGFKKMVVIDMDRIKAHNIPTQTWTRREIGQYKATMLQRAVFESSETMVDAVLKKLETGNVKKMLSDATLVVDGFDNSESRRIVADHCRQAKKDCLHVGLAKDYAEVIWNERYRVPRDVVGLDVCEYPMARNTIILAVGVATETIVRYVATGRKHNYVITLGDFKIEEIA